MRGLASTARPGGGIMSILVAVVVLISLFILAGTFRNTGSQLLATSLETQAFEQRFPGAARPQILSAAARARLVENLSAALTEGDPVTSRLAGFALGRVGDGALPAVPALIGAANCADSGIRRGAVAGLEGIAGLSAPQRVQWARAEEALAWRARKALLKIGTPESVQAAENYSAQCPQLFREPDINWCD